MSSNGFAPALIRRVSGPQPATGEALRTQCKQVCKTTKQTTVKLKGGEPGPPAAAPPAGLTTYCTIDHTDQFSLENTSKLHGQKTHINT